MNSWLNDLPGLHRHERNNRLEIHPDDAAALGVATGDRVEVSSSCGAIELAAVVSDATRPGVVAADHGWGSRVFDPNGAAAPIVHGVNRNPVVPNDNLDPLSQTPALNSTPGSDSSRRQGALRRQSSRR
jgi:formate dehydrogenase